MALPAALSVLLMRCHPNIVLVRPGRHLPIPSGMRASSSMAVLCCQVLLQLALCGLTRGALRIQLRRQGRHHLRRIVRKLLRGLLSSLVRLLRRGKLVQEALLNGGKLRYHAVFIPAHLRSDSPGDRQLALHGRKVDIPGSEGSQQLSVSRTHPSVGKGSHRDSTLSSRGACGRNQGIRLNTARGGGALRSRGGHLGICSGTAGIRKLCTQCLQLHLSARQLTTEDMMKGSSQQREKGARGQEAHKDIKQRTSSHSVWPASRAARLLPGDSPPQLRIWACYPRYVAQPPLAPQELSSSASCLRARPPLRCPGTKSEPSAHRRRIVAQMKTPWDWTCCCGAASDRR